MNLSVIIPTYNMSDYLEPLWQNLCARGLVHEATEVIFVDDGSTDQSSQKLLSLQRAGGGEKLQVLSLPSNVGRFLARYLGAQSAKSEYLLFLDSRVELSEHFMFGLRQVRKYDLAMATVDIEVSKSVFSLYWQRTHEFIFKKNYQDAQAGFFLTPENYDRYVKGTGCLLVPKTLFLEVCAKFESTGLLSDDTALMLDLVRHKPIRVQNSWNILWEPRQNLGDFLARFWERGPSFAEYHIFQRRGLYFRIVMAGLGLFLIWLGILLQNPVWGLYGLLGALGLIGLSTALFSRNLREFFKMLPLQIMVVVISGLAVLRGIWVCGFNKRSFTSNP